MISHVARSAGGAVQRGVVNADKLQVLSEVDVAFHPVSTFRERLQKSSAGVFRVLFARPAVRENQVLHCSLFCHRPYASESAA